MACKACQQDPNFHSFRFFGRARDATSIYYTCPGKGKERKPTEESIENYVAHMDEASLGSWIWFFDCKGIESLDLPNIKVLKKFTELIQERYKFVLQRVVIININWKMNMILSMIKPFMKEEAKERIVVSKGPLEFMTTIEPEILRKIFQNHN